MRTQRHLQPQTSTIYRCEIETCIHCGSVLTVCNYLSGCKIVQTMSEVIEIGYRPKQCPNETCKGHKTSLRSTEWQQIAPMNATYGYDVIATIGWQRQQHRQIYADIHAGLADKVSISASQVFHLSHMRYLPLLACSERQNMAQLQKMSAAQGLILSLDGLAPEGGELQLWLVRELQTGLTVRSGWMSEQNQTAFENFLQPIDNQKLQVTAILSDKQRGLVPALKTVFPEAKHVFCQAHYLNNIAKPVANVDEAMKVTVRKQVRENVGAIIRPDQVEKPGVLMVTGLLPSPISKEQASTLETEGDDGLTTSQETTIPQERDEIVTAFKRRVGYLLTLKGRPPFRLAGLEMYQRLTEVVDCLEILLSHISDETLGQLQQGLKDALALVEPDCLNLEHAEIWLKSISNILDPEENEPRTGQVVKTELFAYLKLIRDQSQDNDRLLQFATQIEKTSLNDSPGLFFSYDIPALPRTNNERESEFRDLNRRLLRTTGQKGATKRIIQRSGAWELIPKPDTFEQTVAALSHIDHDEYKQERQRIFIHRNRFTFHTRSAIQSQKHLNDLKERWFRLTPD